MTGAAHSRPRKGGPQPVDRLSASKKHPSVELGCLKMELLGGFEPPTSSLPRMRSTY